MTKSPCFPIRAVLMVALGSISLTSAGCGQGGSQVRPSAPRSNSLQTPADSLGVLTANLQQLRGSYSIGAHGQWVFSGDRKLFEVIAAHGDSAVARLVDCLDNTTAALATVEGRPVSMGVLCYEALRFTAYAEPEGIDSGEWPGTVMPTTTGQGLRDAKAAWLKVVRQRGYRLH